MSREIWKCIKGYESLYQVSNRGKIWSIAKQKYRRLTLSKDGYLSVILTKNTKIRGFRVHRLVADAFLPNPKKYPLVNHLDADKKNNNLGNLQWCTQKMNVAHAVKYFPGSYSRSGEANGISKLTRTDIVNIRQKSFNESCGAIARQYGVCRSTISRVIKKTMWGHV